LDLFRNPVGSRTSPAKCLALYHFLAVVVQKLKFLNNAIVKKKMQADFTANGKTVRDYL
jgi:hypothetical protein